MGAVADRVGAPLRSLGHNRRGDPGAFRIDDGPARRSATGPYSAQGFVESDRRHARLEIKPPATSWKAIPDP